MFTLDSRLENDTIKVIDSNNYIVLLMNSSELPWFIITPKTKVKEWFELDINIQNEINIVINNISRFIQTEYKIDKINIANIGNVVSQMHIHVVGRYTTDSVWPKPVWGNIVNNYYSESEKNEIIENFLRKVKLD